MGEKLTTTAFKEPKGPLWLWECPKCNHEYNEECDGNFRWQGAFEIVESHCEKCETLVVVIKGK